MATKDVYSHLKDINYDYSNSIYYEWNNWVKRIKNEDNFTFSDAISRDIRLLFEEGGLWLNSDGEICYRFSPFGRVHTASLAKINVVFSNFLGCNFKITQTVPTLTIPREQIKKLQNENKLTISIAQLLLVEAEEFNPHMEQEFYQNQKDRLIYRNTFQPSYFLRLSSPKVATIPIAVLEVSKETVKKQSLSPKYDRPEKSITLQYLYYLCDYHKDRFFWLINWLASFFKNLSNRSENILVLYGNSHSGIDILFQYIIIPLFGEEYTFRITDNSLGSNNTDDKLFYNLKNLSKKVIDNEKKSAYLQKLLPENQKFAQVLITTEEPTIPYSHIDNYTVFYVPKTIEEMYIPDWFNKLDKIKFTQKELIDAIVSDLENFAYILKLFLGSNDDKFPILNDDKNLISYTLEDKLETFVKAVKKMDISYFQRIQKSNNTLYDELKKDFNKYLIKQPNLIEYFNILYPEDKFESSRTLMKKLRSIDELFQTENAKAYTAGKKYFHIPI